MNVTRATPPRPLDVAAVFPELAPFARTATRLHPHPGAPSPRDSSVGGPLLWPADEPWPYCDGPHVLNGLKPAMPLADVRLERRIRAAAHGRDMTSQERETLDRIRPPRRSPTTTRAAARPYTGSIAMLPVAQLHVRDVPGLPTPAGTDLLQVLWCPFDHPPKTYMPRTALFWRNSASVTDILIAPPEPVEVQFDHYVPEPCLLAPEQITEYPNPLELSKELREPLGKVGTWQTANADLDSSYESRPEEFYLDNLSVAPGWKAGGWASWGLTDPISQFCPACDTKMDPLLTIATFEWDHGTRSWIPDEDQVRTGPSPTLMRAQDQRLIDFFRARGIAVHHRGRVPSDIRAASDGISSVPAQPTAVLIGRGYRQQLYVCPTSPEHPHTELMQ